jgi:acyl-CoA thioester hydrolase
VTGEFTVSLSVRAYELDTQRHLNSAVYFQYAEHARWEHLASMGITPDRLLSTGTGPVFLESTIRWHHEVRAGDTVIVGVSYEWPEPPAKTFLIRQSFRLGDQTPVADLTSRCGLLDLATRRLVNDPRGVLAGLASPPSELAPSAGEAT